MQNVCVFCGANPGKEPLFMESAKALGAVISGASKGLVYGGAHVGLMGQVADAVLEGGQKVIGVIPQAFAKNVSHEGLTQLHVVDSMHARKAKMFDLSDAFIALPGGFGTLEELTEVLTWAQLGFHQKPIGLLNINGYYDALIAFIDQAVEAGFIKPQHIELLRVHEDPTQLLQLLENYQPPIAGV
ncbi:MAG: TIGR00730 family Rossman fold protein [Oceanospirillaceae bacterium]|nr:TIGR00730 family Rossman fold protein [Oceanospirillaceae bacterium]